MSGGQRRSIPRNNGVEHLDDLPISVEVVNNQVLSGVPFRDAYKNVGLAIEKGEFERPEKVHHTHEGSIGNLCNDEIRKEMKKVFPELEFKPVPFNHPVYHQQFQFNNGLPKVHEHDGKAPQGFGLVYEGRLVCFYSYECDLGNGWEDQSVYNDPEPVRQKALQMGANLLSFALTSF